MKFLAISSFQVCLFSKVWNFVCSSSFNFFKANFIKVLVISNVCVCVFSNVFKFQATSRSSMRVCMCVFDLQPGPGFVFYFCAHFLLLCFYYSTILLFAISRFWSCFAFVHYFKVLQFFAISRFESKALLMCFQAKQEFCVFQLSSGSELLVKTKAFVLLSEEKLVESGSNLGTNQVDAMGFVLGFHPLFGMFILELRDFKDEHKEAMRQRKTRHKGRPDPNKVEY